jgi:hypothetical protein
MKETYSPSRLGKAHICPARLRPYRDPPETHEIHLSSASGRGLFLHNLIEMWLEKFNESIQLDPDKFLTLDRYLTSVNDWRDKLAAENIQVHGNISELIGEFRSTTHVDTFLHILHQKERIINITTEKTISDFEFEQHIFEDFFVKGIVDCIIETKNQLYLIDWKLSIDPESQLFDSYVLQIGLYHDLLRLTNPPKQLRLLLVSMTQEDERMPLPYMIKTEKILAEYSRINDVRWVDWVQSAKKNPTSQCTFCEYNFSRTELCLDRSNDSAINQNLEILFGFDSIADIFDVEIPLSNVRRISANTYEITHEHKKVEIVFKRPFRLEASASKFLRCTGRLRSQNGLLTFFIHQHIIFPV